MVTPVPHQTSTPRRDGSAMAQVHVIHLENATARLALMQVEFDRIGVTPANWAGVDARRSDNAIRVNELPDHGPWGAMHLHAKGCLLSHLDALDRFMSSDAEYALIVEDDTFIADDISQWLTPADWWPEGADLVKLERWRDDRLKVLLDPATATFAGRDICRLRSRHSGTGGYMINRAGAAKVLAHPGRDLPIDHLLFNVLVSPLACQLTTFQVNPALIVQGNEPDTKSPTVSSARSKTLGHIIKRGLAELRALRTLPRLLTGQSRLQSITWQNRAHSA